MAVAVYLRRDLIIVAWGEGRSPLEGGGVAFRSSLKYKKGLETRRSRSSRDFRL